MNTTHTKMAEMSLFSLLHMYAPDTSKTDSCFITFVFLSQFRKYLLIQYIKRPYKYSKELSVIFHS